MFNVRPDQLWPWIRFEPPSEDPPGFRMAADGSIWVGESGSAFPGYGSGANPLASFGIDFGNAYRAASSGFDRQGSGAGLIPSFGSGSLPPFVTSLLFPQLTEPQTVWPSPQGHIGMPAKPDTSVPGLHHFKPPADNPPGFRVAADGSVPSDSQGNSNLSSLRHDPHTDIAPTTSFGTDAAILPIEDSGNWFDLLNGRHPSADPPPPFDGGSLPPDASSLLFPRMTESRFSWPGLPDDSDELDAGADGLLPGLRAESPTDNPPSFHIAADNSVRDDLSDNFGLSSFGYDPLASAAPPVSVDSADRVRPDSTNPATYLDYDPTYFPAPPQDPVQDALDQIARLYRINWQGSDGRPVMFRGGGSANGPTAAVGDAFDPRYIVPTGGPTRPPPGPGHNSGPPLRPDSTTRIPTQPSRAGPNQGIPTAPRPPDNGAAAANAAAAEAAPAEQRNEPVPTDAEADEKLEAWQKIAKARGNEAPDGQYLGPGGVNTWVGVRLNPKLPEPAAGWHYRPALRHLRNGYRGELEFANRIVAALPNEIVIHYGMPAGRQGPDVISLSPNGTVSIWDSKWRSGQRSISSSQRAHKSEESFESLQWELRQRIAQAVRSGHLAPDVAAAARKNVDAGNFDIYTVGTGNAHSGVAESVRDRIRSGTWRP